MNPSIDVRVEVEESYEPPRVVELGTIPELTQSGLVGHSHGHGHIAGGS